jgi:hypothetical protein
MFQRYSNNMMVDMGYSKQLAGGGAVGAGNRIAPNGSSLAHNVAGIVYRANRLRITAGLPASKQAQEGALLAALITVTPPPRFMLVFA